jgi:hypothetical protein
MGNTPENFVTCTLACRVIPQYKPLGVCVIDVSQLVKLIDAVMDSREESANNQREVKNEAHVSVETQKKKKKKRKEVTFAPS